MTQIVTIFLFSSLLYNFIFASDNTFSSNTMPLATVMDQNLTLNNNFSNCFLFDIKSWVHYDLNSIGRSDDSFYDFNITTSDMVIYFDFCNNTIFKCQGVSSLVSVKYKNEFCVNYSYDKDTLKQWKYSLKDEKVLSLKLFTPERCREGMNFSTSFNFKCDENMPEGKFEVDVQSGAESGDNISNYNSDDLFNDFTIDNDSYTHVNTGTSIRRYLTCERRLFFKSKAACPQQILYPIWRFYLENEYIFGMCYILLGFYLLFFGLKNEVLTSFILGYILFMFIVYTTFIFINFDHSYIGLLWNGIIIQISLAIILSILMLKIEKIFLIVCGSSCGFSISNLAFYILLYFNSHSDKDILNPIALFFITTVVIVLISTIVFLCMCSKENAVIITTSLTGSYMIIKGTSFYAGGIPFEGYLIDLRIKGENKMFSNLFENNTTYLYLIISLVLDVLGLTLQFIQKRLTDMARRGAVGNKSITTKLICSSIRLIED